MLQYIVKGGLKYRNILIRARGFLLGMIIGFKSCRKNIFCLILNAYFDEIENINFGSKFLAWVSLHTASSKDYGKHLKDNGHSTSDLSRS